MSNKHRQLRDHLTHHMPGRFLIDEPLSAHTWYRIGGPADFFAYPGDREQVASLMCTCRDLNIPILIIGDGANILASDAGFRGLALCMLRGPVSLTFSDREVEADAGVSLRRLVCECEERGLSGVVGLTGIPGTVGGALVMNAGTDKGEIGDAVVHVAALDSDLRPATLRHGEIGFGYRSAPRLRGHTVLGCRLRLIAGDKDALRENRLALLKRRVEKQPLEFPSCGSVFKRPSGHYVGQLVQEAGLKGLRHGDAMISEKHGGFIINLGTATAADVLWLIAKVEDEIYKRFGVALECEVRKVGF